VRITVLGCGTSMGVPQLGCRCAVCTSDDPRNHRTRPSVHIQHGKTQILIDAPPNCACNCGARDWISTWTPC
jgi:phosphoribosyl 1,2-cyclic phosphate phosphodiesterase